jgi:hypothetical protein
MDHSRLCVAKIMSSHPQIKYSRPSHRWITSGPNMYVHVHTRFNVKAVQAQRHESTLGAGQ